MSKTKSPSKEESVVTKELLSEAAKLFRLHQAKETAEAELKVIEAQKALQTEKVAGMMTDALLPAFRASGEFSFLGQVILGQFKKVDVPSDESAAAYESLKSIGCYEGVVRLYAPWNTLTAAIKRYAEDKGLDLPDVIARLNTDAGREVLRLFVRPTVSFRK